MKKFLIIALLMGGCAPSNYGKETPVIIDGKVIYVYQNEKFTNTWKAFELRVIDGDLNRYSRNLRAIKQVSGCEPDLGTVLNTGVSTEVTVDCRRQR